MKGSVARYDEGERTELWRIFRISPHRFRHWPTGNTVLR